METRKRVLGEEHPDTFTSIDNLAFMVANKAGKITLSVIMQTLLQFQWLAGRCGLIA